MQYVIYKQKTNPGKSIYVEFRVDKRGGGNCVVFDKAFLDDVDWRPEVSLAVASTFGTSTPAVGSHALAYGDEVVASVSVPAASNGIRHACMGWTGTGSVPATGVGTNVSFEIEEDSSITWNWKTQNLISVTVTGAGSCDFGSRWVDDGDTASAALISDPSRHYSIILSGDTDGVTIDGATLSILSDRPRSVNVKILIPDLIENGGTPFSWTAMGYDAGWSIVADSDAVDGYVLRSDDIGASEAAFVEATVDGPGRLAFDWRISANRGDYARIYVDGVQAAQITRNTAWAPASVVVEGDGAHTVRWAYERGSGSASGEDAAFLDNVCWQPFSLSDVLDAGNVEWSSCGAAEWFPQVAVSHDGADAARSGQVIGDDVSGLETTLAGPGTLSWFWRLDAAGNSGVDVMLDGVWLDAYEPTGEWTEESLGIGEGEHTVRFEFWNAGTAATISDCAYLDQVSWMPEVPESVEVDGVEVPVSWLDEFPTLVEKYSGSHETAASATAANGINTVAECYVAGLCPTNSAAAFRTVISWKDGTPEISWEPELSPEEAAKRTYRKFGRKSLTDPKEDWTEINGDEASYNFFKVSVEMTK